MAIRNLEADVNNPLHWTGLLVPVSLIPLVVVSVAVFV
jgi:hypothetical protein